MTIRCQFCEYPSVRQVMRTITIPPEVIQRAAHGPIEGNRLEFAVQVDWPELRLTEAQILANVIARLNDEPEPYPDHSIFSVTVPYIASAVVATEEKTP